ncbi:MAG: O-antigen ligase family protein [Bacteroidota bacterium]
MTSIRSLSHPINLLFLAILLTSVTIVATLDAAVFLPIALLGSVFVFWSYRNPVVWLFSVILMHAIFLRRTQEISPQEVFFGVYFYGYFAYWLIDSILVRGKALIMDRAGGWLLVFLFVSLVSIVIGFLNNVVPGLWFREVLITSVLFVFFPAREILRKEVGMKAVVVSLVLLSVGLAAYNLTMYTSSALAAEIYGGLLGRRQPGSVHFFFAMVVLAASVWVHGPGGTRYRSATALVFLINAAALAATFTRGFWIAAVAALVLLFLLAEGRKKLMLLWSTVVVAGGATAAVLAFGGLGKAAIMSLFARFVSSGEALQDVSFTNRIAESTAIIDAIFRSPFIGHGFGTSFRFFNLLVHTTVETWYAHNGYLFLLFKVGLIGTIAFLGFYSTVLWRGFLLTRIVPVGSEKRAFVHGSWAVLASLLVVTVTSNVFIEREPLLLIALAGAFLINEYEGAGVQRHPPIKH